MIDPTSEDVVERLEELTGGIGPDLVFDCAGARPTLDQAMNIVRRDGQVMLVAVAWEETPLLPVDWMSREVSIQSTWGARDQDWQIALELFRTGKVVVGPDADRVQLHRDGRHPGRVRVPVPAHDPAPDGRHAERLTRAACTFSPGGSRLG